MEMLYRSIVLCLILQDSARQIYEMVVLFYVMASSCYTASQTGYGGCFSFQQFKWLFYGALNLHFTVD